ncbi:MAG: dephospho-CoA kinase [bacterium]
MRIVGLTGGIASGKSTVSEMFRRLGAEIVDADLTAREVVRPGRWAWKRIVARFGPEVVQADGQIDRKRLGQRIFESPSERRYLNWITHPPIYLEILKDVARRWRRRAPLVMVDAALLYETPLRFFIQPVIVVYTDPERQLERLMRRDGVNREEALARIRSQLPLEEKKKRAEYVIDNSGTTVETQRQVVDLWRKITSVS